MPVGLDTRVGFPIMGPDATFTDRSHDDPAAIGKGRDLSLSRDVPSLSQEEGNKRKLHAPERNGKGRKLGRMDVGGDTGQKVPSPRQGPDPGEAGLQCEGLFSRKAPPQFPG